MAFPMSRAENESTASLVVSAVAAGIALPFCSFALALPWWISLAVSAVVFGVFYIVLRPRRFDIDLDEMNDVQADTVQALLSEGLNALDRLRAAAENMSDRPMRQVVGALCDTADNIFARLRQQPARAMSVRRFLTFYLPNAASIAEGWRTLENNRRPSPERVTQTRQVMSSLKGAFARFENETEEPELQELDLDLKLVRDALRADLENFG